MSFLESLASLLFPPRCAFCGKPGVHGVCSECEKALPYCKTPLHERAEIGACLAPLKYEGIVREALLNYKFHAGQSRCTGFGDVLAQAAAEHFGGEFDLVTYVPVSKKRKQERGYDQSYLLARETCRHWSVAPETLLQKTKDNVAQSSLSSREERQKNVVGAYVAVNEDKIKGQRILLIDDEADILEFMEYNLRKAGHEVFTAQNGADGLRQAALYRPHLILLDRMMPVMDGMETCRAIRADPALRDTMIVFLSALSEEEHQIAGFGAGADDYIAKPVKMKILMSRVQAILKRIDAEAAPAEPAAAGITVDRERYAVLRDGHEVALPRKEFALLDLLYSSPGKLFSREEIYAKIWGTEVVVGDRTIDVHIRKLRQKIGDEKIVTVKGVGYKYEP